MMGFFRSIHRLSLRKRLFFLLFLMLFTIKGSSIYQLSVMTQVHDAGKKTNIVNKVNTTKSIVLHFYGEFLSGNLQEEDAKKNAIEMINSLDVGDVIFIYDYNTCELLAYKSRQDLVNTNGCNMTSSNGVPHAKKYINLVLNDGEGFYQQLAETKDRKLKQKTLYISSFKPWKWMFGTGDFIDNYSKEYTGVLIEMILITTVWGFLIIVVVNNISGGISNKIRIMEKLIRMSKQNDDAQE